MSIQEKSAKGTPYAIIDLVINIESLNCFYFLNY